MNNTDGNDWYSNKDLFEMMQVFKSEVSNLTEEMGKTTTLIRDYNGLRGTINEVDKRVTRIEEYVVNESKNNKSRKQNKRDYIAWVFAFLMFMVALVQYLGTLNG